MENSTAKYEKFIKVNQLATKKCVPVTKNARRTLLSKHPSVVEAREVVKNVRKIYDNAHSMENKNLQEEARQKLFASYDSLREDENEVLSNVQRIKARYSEGRYTETLKGINEVTDRKKTKEGQISGASPQERVNTWFTHFQNLLDNPPSTDVDESEVIPAFFSNLDINDVPFTLAEYVKVKRSLKQEKSSGPDGIPLQLLKNCDLDIIQTALRMVRLKLTLTFDIALLSNVVDHARKLLTLTESECKKVGLQLNSKKTEVIQYNSSVDTPLKTMEGKEL